MISVKSAGEIAIMREGGRILAQVLEELMGGVRPGMSTLELDKSAEEKIRKAGAKPAFLHYQGFPNTLCASLNNEVVHAIPSDKKILKEGDILSLDLGLMYKGYYSDIARTVPVGKISKEATRLVEVTKKALQLGTAKARPGATLGDIGYEIQRFVESEGFSVVRELCGHGIGKELHEEPQVLNFGERKIGLVLKEGMVLSIEPMVTAGEWNVKLAKDGQTYLTRDGSLAAHFEDTVAITAQGPEVLTRLK
ncbi:MAG: type I methionyl aminopeptidase [Candidatus Wildermuthbacteria bacterium RIFCSPLOWO2_02_FULL_47_9c]|uniref:Methionine aminopeptidase n=2 Tax=Parcubacteria group TaxID=1794811 RepID=A0A837ILT6_9BACT|nr:MAG: Methionine aminopeptidase [Candidatus Yanofskybacteria bacterium GW2011_GWC1_48_11]KKW04577.1 MAG: Methionine aminopeptidase [Parcubacteria group bacterium GW2011_GWB1_49_12]KKW09165.1 MAG: Methionine aminopeptidase [Parcubacteria group bacterium GW2011_GWA1_49_26]KKW13500.1 MAG: Methionine aminopeptidase [Parcubacteria group bacterium GW2011_GWA2_50_10]OHA61418.1 MAG: type I methionyl aminopeptidase [Candidatus Wildermuthbacteria bacterium GWA1_49_26]OHA66239.1 MAG: type I methionyl a